MRLAEVLAMGPSFRYRLLSRMRADCLYYLGPGGRHPKHLWAGSVGEQLYYMRAIWDSLEEKPEWLTYDELLEFKRRMADNEED